MVDILLHHYIFDYTIDPKDSIEPLWGPIYILSLVELIAVQEYLDQILRTIKI
jgi:hypothetical protein